MALTLVTEKEFCQVIVIQIVKTVPGGGELLFCAMQPYMARTGLLRVLVSGCQQV
jgi:hypothetical protein